MDLNVFVWILLAGGAAAGICALVQIVKNWKDDDIYIGGGE